MLVLATSDPRLPLIQPFSESALESMSTFFDRVRKIIHRRPRVLRAPVNLVNISPGARRAIFEDWGLDSETIHRLEDYYASLSIFGQARRHLRRNLQLVRLVTNFFNSLRASSPASCRRIGGSGFFTAAKANLRNAP